MPAVFVRLRAEDDVAFPCRLGMLSVSFHNRMLGAQRITVAFFFYYRKHILLEYWNRQGLIRLTSYALFFLDSCIVLTILACGQYSYCLVHAMENSAHRHLIKLLYTTKLSTILVLGFMEDDSIRSDWNCATAINPYYVRILEYPYAILRSG